MLWCWWLVSNPRSHYEPPPSSHKSWRLSHPDPVQCSTGIQYSAVQCSTVCLPRNANTGGHWWPSVPGCDMWAQCPMSSRDLGSESCHNLWPSTRARPALIGRVGASVTDPGWNMTDIRMICRTEMSHNSGSSPQPTLHIVISLASSRLSCLLECGNDLFISQCPMQCQVWCWYCQHMFCCDACCTVVT